MDIETRGGDVRKTVAYGAYQKEAAPVGGMTDAASWNTRAQWR
jgi:hypothetical protein